MLHAFDYSGKHFYCIDASKGWQESPYALKSDLFHNGFITDPNTATVPFTLVNGWDSNVTNVPDDIKGSWGELTTTWVYSEQIGSLTAYRMQKIVSDKNVMHTRTYSNSKWAEWR